MKIPCRFKETHLLSLCRFYLGDSTLEQVYSYCYLGILVTSTLTWKDHIQQICTKARKLVGILHTWFYTCADTSALRSLYLTCLTGNMLVNFGNLKHIMAFSCWNLCKYLLGRCIGSNVILILIVCLNC